MNMNKLLLPVLLLLHPLVFDLFNLSEPYFNEVLFMFDPQLLPLHELERVLSICQLPLSLIQLMLHQ